MGELLGDLDDRSGGKDILVSDKEVEESTVGFVVDGLFPDSDSVECEDNPVGILDGLTGDLDELRAAEIGWIYDFEVFGSLG